METDRKFLIAGLQELSIIPSDSVVGKFEAYLSELKKWNRVYNLTALKADKDIIAKHFIDSLLFLKFIPEERLSICDIGSGAGFPGLPLAIVMPQIKLTLIEPQRKKISFLKHIKRLLSLSNVDIIESRIEDVRDIHFDIAVTRALFSIDDLLKKAGHVLKREGYFVLNKGPKIKEEIKEISQKARCELMVVKLPLVPENIQRHIIKVSIEPHKATNN